MTHGNKQHNFDRWDHKIVYEIVPNGSSVLDLGCGDGELLSYLSLDKGVTCQGIEINLEKINTAISRGVPVIHHDLDEGLGGFPDNFFDYVILQKTIQAVKRPMLVLDEMLRVGRFGVVSFPNFGHKDVIDSLVTTKRMPRTRILPYTWYDTPNIHLCTINDFLDWTSENGVLIAKAFVWTGGKVERFEPGIESIVEEALFVVYRKEQ